MADFDRTFLLDLAGDDPQGLRLLLNEFVSFSPAKVNEIVVAIEAGDLAHASHCAHQLRASSRWVGAARLSAMCARIENNAAVCGDAELEDIGRDLMPALSEALAAIIEFCEDLDGSVSASPRRSVATKTFIIDDDRFVGTLLARQLRQLGLGDVSIFTDGMSALAAVKADIGAVALVFCDLQLPGMDGVVIVRELAAMGYGGGFVVVSGKEERLLESVEQLVKASGLRLLGALPKPPSLERLRALIATNEPLRTATETPARDLLDAPDGEDLRAGIAGDQIICLFQPKVRLSDGALTGVESLARWQHPEKGLLTPEHFIPLAEETGQIGALTRAVIQSALRQVKIWEANGLNIPVSVNISMNDLVSVDFPEMLMGLIDGLGVDKRLIILELTESQVTKDRRVMLDIVTRLRLRNISLSIDDFGTGHSSLSQLQDIPFDELKIDRRFVHHAWEHRTSLAMFQSSLSLARQLGMHVVAEGVEDEEDWHFLVDAGCDAAQGYFVSRPLPGDALLGWLDEWQGRFHQLKRD